MLASLRGTERERAREREKGEKAKREREGEGERKSASLYFQGQARHGVQRAEKVCVYIYKYVGEYSSALIPYSLATPRRKRILQA